MIHPICYQIVVCNVGVLWPNGWIDQDATEHTQFAYARTHNDHSAYQI